MLGIEEFSSINDANVRTDTVSLFVDDLVSIEDIDFITNLTLSPNPISQDKLSKAIDALDELSKEEELLAPLALLGYGYRRVERCLDLVCLYGP